MTHEQWILLGAIVTHGGHHARGGVVSGPYIFEWEGDAYDQSLAACLGAGLVEVKPDGEIRITPAGWDDICDCEDQQDREVWARRRRAMEGT